MSQASSGFNQAAQVPHASSKGPFGAAYIPNEEERRVFRECNSESFWYRSLPFSAIAIGITQVMVSRDPANDRFFKVGIYDVKGQQVPPQQKMINAYFITACLAPPTDSRMTCNSKVLSTYRSSRKKHQEQLWRLEKQITIMNERHATKEAELSATLEAMEWRKEETIL